MSKINRGDIVVGQPLAFDCYDSKGSLLLQRGQMILSAKQVDTLLERGLFSTTNSDKNEIKGAGGEKKSIPFELFETGKERLRVLFSRIKIDQAGTLPERIVFEDLQLSYRRIIGALEGGKPDNFQEKILHVSKGIQELCRLDSDAALGSIHLDHLCRYTTIHPMHKAVLSELLARRLNLPADERLSIISAALTANISILNLQEALHKQKTPLNAAQQEMLRLHPMLSVEMLSELGVKDELWTRVVSQHHERQDGSGYPKGLSAGEISRGARIIALADIYGAMIKPRAHRPAIHAKDALRDLFLQRSEKDSDDLVHPFIKELGIYPPGCFVRLQNGETAIVTRRGANPATPKVKSILDSTGLPLPHFVSRDTAMKPLSISGILPRNKNIAVNFKALWDYKFAA